MDNFSLTCIQKNKEMYFKSLFFLSHTQIQHVLNVQLISYMLIDDFQFLRVGGILRCLSLDNNEFHLKPPCIIVDIQMTRDGISCKCKFIRRPSFFHVTASDNCRFFQKLTNDQLVLLHAMDNVI